MVLGGPCEGGEHWGKALLSPDKNVDFSHNKNYRCPWHNKRSLFVLRTATMKKDIVTNSVRGLRQESQKCEVSLTWIITRPLKKQEKDGRTGEGEGKKRDRKGAGDQRSHLSQVHWLYFSMLQSASRIFSFVSLQNAESEGAELSWSGILRPHSEVSHSIYQ